MQSEAELNEISRKVIGAAIDVHRALGPGLLESSYQACLAYEMAQRGLRFRQQVELPLIYKEVHLDCGYRLDFVVEDSVVVELKAIDDLLPVHEAQLISYLKLGHYHLGLLLNFNVKVLKNGIRRFVNELNYSAASAGSAVK
jgi:GxxExxY protein